MTAARPALAVGIAAALLLAVRSGSAVSALRGDTAAPAASTTIAFVRSHMVDVGSGEDEIENVTLVDTRNRRERRLLRPIGSSAPAWSPDGRRVAFWFGDRLAVARADGSGLRRLGTIFHHAWSPDGRLIAGTMDPRRNDLVVLRPDGSGRRRLVRMPTGTRQPAWSPDGRFIAFVSPQYGEYPLYVVQANGGGPRRLTPPDFPVYAHSWAADSRQLVVEARPSGNRRGVLALVSSDGTGLQLLENADAGSQPSWSPAGSLFAYSALSGIAVYDTARGTSTPLTRGNDLSPVWSPDGRQIAFERRVNNVWRIHVVSRDGSGLRQISHGGGRVRDLSDRNPVWRPSR